MIGIRHDVPILSHRVVDGALGVVSTKSADYLEQFDPNTQL